MKIGALDVSHVKHVSHFDTFTEAYEEAKRQVGPGKWIGWVKDNLSFGEKQAQNYMKIGRLDAKRISHLDSWTEAYEEAKRDTQTEDYLKRRQEKVASATARLRDTQSVITEEDQHEAMVLLPEIQKALVGFVRKKWQSEKRQEKKIA